MHSCAGVRVCQMRCQIKEREPLHGVICGVQDSELIPWKTKHLTSVGLQGLRWRKGQGHAAMLRHVLA